MTTYLRYRQIRRADDVTDQETSLAILGAIPSSVTEEDYQRFFLSRLRQVIYGNAPGTHHWYDDFLGEGILSLKDLSGILSPTVRVGFPFPDPKNGINRVFSTTPLKFVHDLAGTGKTIEVWHNGRRLIQTAAASPGAGDYTVSESGGLGTGFDTITLLTFAPVGKSSLVADFQVAP
jgi:hypothetical protein